MDIESVLKEKYNLEGSELKIMTYRIKLLQGFIPMMIVFIIVAAIFNLWLELIMISVVGQIVRTSYGGIHFASGLKCFIISAIYVFLLIMLSRIHTSIWFYVLGNVFVLYVIKVYVPRGTSLLPIVREKVIRQKKRNAMIFFILQLPLYFILSSYTYNLIMYNQIISALAVLPIAYRLFGVREFRTLPNK